MKLSKNTIETNVIVYEGDEMSSDCVSNNKNEKSNYNNNEDKTTVPLEIDTHFQIYGKHVWEVEYGERCAICNTRIDEYGLCACGSGGE
jgi:hypothetical protein